MAFTNSLNFKNNKRLSLPLPSITISPPSTSSLASWLSCKHPNTSSTNEHDNIYTGRSWFTSSSDDESDSLSSNMNSDEECFVDELKFEDRLLHKPSMNTKSIMEECKAGEAFPFKKSSVHVVDSNNPYFDFKLSMAEVVAAHGLDGMEYLEELLEWYLKVNVNNRHGVIVEAFVDLMLEIFPYSSSSSSDSSS